MVNGWDGVMGVPYLNPNLDKIGKKYLPIKILSCFQIPLH